MKKTIKLEGANLHIIPTNKFKNICVSIKLASPLTKETTTIRTMLSFMLSGGTAKYPSSQLFSAHLESLYGANFSSSIASKGNAHILHLFGVCVDEQYLPKKENLFEKQMEFLHDILFNPNIQQNHFNENVFKQKKQEYKWRMQALKDDKYSYSLEKMIEIMGENQILGIPTFGYEEEIDQITSSDLYKYFLKCLDEDQIDIYVVGDVKENIEELVNKYLPFKARNSKINAPTCYVSNRNHVEEKIEKQEIVQAKLNMGYSVNTKFDDDDFYAFTIFNGLFGGFAHSLLFKTVREEHSLCYYINSSYDAFNGIMCVTAGIEGENFEKTKDLVQQQLGKIQKGDFDTQLIDITKRMFENNLIKANDDIANIIALAYNRDLVNKCESNDQYINKLNAVTKEDVIRVSQKVKLDTIFLLEGNEE